MGNGKRGEENKKSTKEALQKFTKIIPLLQSFIHARKKFKNWVMAKEEKKKKSTKEALQKFTKIIPISVN